MLQRRMDPRRVRGWAWQFCLLALLASAIFYLGNNAADNLAARHIPVGFSFLGERAGFDIEETQIEWNPSDTYGRVILVGIANTLTAALVSIIASTILGLLVALMRLSSNPLFRGTGAAFVGLMRNIPQLLLVVFWYSVVLRSLPAPRDSFSIGKSIFLNVRGLYLPAPTPGALMIILGMPLVAVAGAVVVGKFYYRRPGEGRKLSLIIFCALTTLATLATVAAIPTGSFSYPRLQGFNFTGGTHVFPEFVALTVALSLSWAAYIGEIIRAGILSVDRGQIDAALSIGLKRWLVLRLVVMPQALRVIIPPLTSEYLSLTKATSLGVAVAYPELVTLFAGIVLSRTGQEIEVMLITMLTYLSISLSISALMNFYNARFKIVSR